MTTAADDSAVEGAFEAYLAGRPVPAQAAGLTAFAEAVRGAATQPGKPSAALAELLATGLLTDQSSPSARTAPSAGAPPSRAARSRRRRRFTMIFPALLAKILSAGAVAQAATGAGIAVVVVTGAGAAGVLPDPAQQVFSSVVGTEAPAEETTPTEETAEETTPTEETAEEIDSTQTELTDTTGTEPTEDAEVEQPEDGTEDGTGEDEVEYRNHGERVSDAAHNGGVDGQQVREWAHQRNQERAEQRSAESTQATPTAEPTDEPTDEPEPVEVEAGNDRSGGNSGKGGRGRP